MFRPPVRRLFPALPCALRSRGFRPRRRCAAVAAAARDGGSIGEVSLGKRKAALSGGSWFQNATWF